MRHNTLPSLGWLLLLLAFTACSESKPEFQNRDLTAYVNPFVGTGGHGHTWPGASVPFGMVQLSPDTRLEGWDGCGGYHFSDSVIYGFSHTHLSGTGVSDYGDILLMPMSGDKLLNNGSAQGHLQGYASLFSHEKENARPGYYEVDLLDEDIHVELTASERCGFHRYTFSSGEPAWVLIDLVHRDQVLTSDFSWTEDGILSGSRISKAWATRQEVYFAISFSQEIREWQFYQDDEAVEGKSAEGQHLKALLRVEDPAEQLVIKVALSPVSQQNALENLKNTPSSTFDAAKARADSLWNAELNRIQVSGGSEEQRRIFYTALYHSFLAPNLFSDHNGQYRGMDGKVHQADSTRVYTVFSLWDTFRATHPLFTLVQQGRTEEFLRTFLLQYQQGGILPIWELAGNYTGCMIGYHAIPVIADALLKDLEGPGAEALYEAMKHSALQRNLGLDSYQQLGFIPSGKEPESVSKTLEYAYDDWCIAQIARKLGKEKDYQLFSHRAQYYKNLYDAESKFMRARVNGGWFRPFDPSEVNFNYTEANSWQYSLFAPQDISGLTALLGGPDSLEVWLDRLFSASSATTGRDQADITGLIGQYAHGNEPSHHMAYLYNYCGKPSKSAGVVREILRDLYADAPDGLSGNEDCGQMSSWYVFSAMGFYPVTPGMDYYAIGTPLFDTVSVNLENGKQFRLIARNNGPDRPYIQSASLNGEDWPQSWLPHAAIIEGGELIVEMGAEPSSWATAPEHWPVSAVNDHPLTISPSISADARTFSDSLQVSLHSPDTGVVIYYTLDGSTPTEFAEPYGGAFTLDTTSVVKAAAFHPGNGASFPVEAVFHKIEGGRSIVLSSEYANQYSAGGEGALIDYLRGGNDFRTGLWQGFREDLEAVVDLGEIKELKKVGAGFLQDIRSWIWMPKEIEMALSTDGRNFRTVAKFASEVPDDQEGSIVRDYVQELSRQKARYVRLRAQNYGVCPDWHLGAGGKTWIFADEIIIE